MHSELKASNLLFRNNASYMCVYHNLFFRDEGYQARRSRPGVTISAYKSIRFYVANVKDVYTIRRIHRTIFRPQKENEIPSHILRVSMNLPENYISAYANKTTEAFKNKSKEIEGKVSYELMMKCHILRFLKFMEL